MYLAEQITKYRVYWCFIKQRLPKWGLANCENEILYKTYYLYAIPVVTAKIKNCKLRLCLLNTDGVINILIKVNKPTAARYSTITSLGYQINS